MTAADSANQFLPLGPVIVDVEGASLTDHERQRLRHPLVGGVILFSRNFVGRQELIELCREIHALRDEPLLICVDHEGGRVQRFRDDGFTLLPPMSAFGEIWMDDSLAAMRLATETGYVLGAELRACGVDLSFTPVLDLDYPEDSTADTDMNVVMGDDGGIIEIQGTAEAEPFSETEFAAMLGLAKQGIAQLHQLQKQALLADQVTLGENPAG